MSQPVEKVTRSVSEGRWVVKLSRNTSLAHAAGYFRTFVQRADKAARTGPTQLFGHFSKQQNSTKGRIMTAISTPAQVSVFTSPLAINAVLVGNTLKDNGISATVVESNGAFVGTLFAPSEVFVPLADEVRARRLVEIDETFHLEQPVTNSLNDQSFGGSVPR